MGRGQQDRRSATSSEDRVPLGVKLPVWKEREKKKKREENLKERSKAEGRKFNR